MQVNRRKLRRSLGSRVVRRRSTKAGKNRQRSPRARLAELIQRLEAIEQKKKWVEIVVIPPSDGIDVVQP